LRRTAISGRNLIGEPFIDRDDGIWFEEQLMSSLSFRSSRPDGWIHPRPHQDASLRYMKHGPIQPMEEPSLLARLFGRY
jgi:hypothetical protein